MKILMTGASSFTGYWFAKVLSKAGHQITATMQKNSVEDYSGIRKKRVEELNSCISLIFNCSSGDEAFIEQIQKLKPDILCLHGHDNRNYRSPDYDSETAIKSALNNIELIFSELVSSNSSSKVVHTGTYFEQEEGGGEVGESAINPYALSKKEVASKLQVVSKTIGVPLSRFIIPNPFGPMEEGRFTTYLVESWKNGEVPSVRTPEYIRDNIHVSALALAYLDFVTEEIHQSGGLNKVSPSQYREKQGDFTLRFANEMSKRTNLNCSVELGQQTDFPEPERRINSDALDYKSLGWNESQAWDEIALFYQL
jgi:nucleoside-diphosphate-sugar epimerase